MRSSQLRVFLSAFAALAVLQAQAAWGDGVDAGVSAPDAGVSAPDAGVSAPDAGAVDASPVDAALPPPPSGELAMPPELAPPATSATLATSPFVDTPAPEQAEPPRPITRRLWFWLAISGLIVTGVAIGIAAQSPTVHRPECPSGYVCPL